MYELPPHLQSLNAIQPSGSPPSSALSADQEAEFWAFMNTDELFSNFGIAPQAFESKQQAKEEKTKGADPTTLESFLATFVGETAAPTPTPDYLLAALGAPLTTSPPSATAAPAPTPAPAVRAEEDDDDEDEDDDDDDAPRVTGAKRLKMMGAGQAEIEEDKRRRNTEASARFRAKKKAREKALEDRAKELEAQVATLTAEKASLEKENNLLKFVIVNGQGNQGSGASVATSADGLQAALAALGKRKQRDE